MVRTINILRHSDDTNKMSPFLEKSAKIHAWIKENINTFSIVAKNLKISEMKMYSLSLLTAISMTVITYRKCDYGV